MGTLISGLPVNAFTDFFIGGDIRLLGLTDGIERPYITDGITAWQMGIDPPAAVPTFDSNVNGSLDESANYYTQSTYRRSLHSVIGNGSGASAVMTTSTSPNDGIRVDIPAETVQSGVDQVQMYRTQGGGTIQYYDGRKAYSGSAITYDLTIADSALGAAIETDNNIPEARPYGTYFDGRWLLWGSITYSTGTVEVNGTTTVTGTDTVFTKGMEGKKFKLDDESTEYTIETYVSATELTLSTAHATSSSGNTYTISIKPLVLKHSKISSSATKLLESWPTDNYDDVGGAFDENEKPTGIGKTSRVIIPFTDRNAYYTYFAGANTLASTKVLHAGIGCMNFRTIVTAAKTGDCIWLDQNANVRRSTGIKGEPYNLSKLFVGNILDGTHDGIHNDYAVDTSKYADFHAVYYGLRGWYMLFITISGSTYPNACLICDLNINPTGEAGPSPWMLWDGFNAVSSGMKLDTNKNLRPHIGDDLGFIWKLDTGTNDYGSSTTGKTTTGSPTSTPSSTVLTDTGATFPTAGDGLKGTKLRTYNATTWALENDVVIQSNTATALTVTAWDSTPTTDSIYIVGGIAWCRYDKAQHDGRPRDRKDTHYLDITTDKAASSYNLRVEHFTDLSSTAVIAGGRAIDVSINSKPDTIPDEATGHYHQRKYFNYYADQPIAIRNITRDSELGGRQ